MGKENTVWQRITHGFQLSGLLQYYSALPFNITSGTTTIQGTAARSTINGAFIGRNAGRGFDFVNVNARLSRTFQTTEKVPTRAVLIAHGTAGHGSLPRPDNPVVRLARAVSKANGICCRKLFRLNYQAMSPSRLIPVRSGQ